MLYSGVRLHAVSLQMLTCAPWSRIEVCVFEQVVDSWKSIDFKAYRYCSNSTLRRNNANFGTIDFKALPFGYIRLSIIEIQ